MRHTTAMEFGGALFLAFVLGGLWLAWRNLREALRTPASAPVAHGAIVGALLGWLIGR